MWADIFPLVFSLHSTRLCLILTITIIDCIYWIRSLCSFIVIIACCLMVLSFLLLSLTSNVYRNADRIWHEYFYFEIIALPIAIKHNGEQPISFHMIPFSLYKKVSNIVVFFYFFFAFIGISYFCHYSSDKRGNE